MNDLLDDALAELRISGTVLLHECYRAPWAVAIPPHDALATRLGAGSGARVVVFHLVRSGGFELRPAGGAVQAVDAGELVLVTGGAAHRIGAGASTHAVRIEQLLDGRPPAAAPGGGGAETELVCGAFRLRATPLDPLLGALPPVMHVPTSGAQAAPVLAGAAALLVHEVDRGAAGGFAAARLLELLCAEAIRAWAAGPQAPPRGWLRAQADARIGAALARLHADPAAPWPVAALAAHAALSPSRFAARFRQATGQSVGSYVAAWRAHLACRLLRDTRLGVADVARRVGYDSAAAFSRAFRAQVGASPQAWRASAR